MSNNILKYIEKAMDYSKIAIIGLNIDSKKTFFQNKTARELFSDENEIIDIDRIFSVTDSSEHWEKTIEEQLNAEGCTTIYDICILTNKDINKVADIQLSYVDYEDKVLFIEFHFKEDTRMKQTISQVNQSPRAEGILVLDEKLSIVHCNEFFYNVFDADNQICKNHFNNSLSNSFIPEIREQLTKEIQENLNKSPTYFTKLKVITSKGDEKWYSLELQRRTLDDTGIDKVIAYLVNIEKQIETEEQLENISQYFSVIQSMLCGKLYRFDIKNRIMYRCGEYADSYNLPITATKYPDVDHLKEIVHPDDLQPYINFVEKVIEGYEGSYDSRIKKKNGEYEYHRMTFKPLIGKDGNIKEMIGVAKNIHSLKETEEKLDTVNQYFNTIQNLSDDMLYRVDLNSRTLYRTSEQAEMFGLNPVMPNYPYSILETGIIHIDDEKSYLQYGKKLLEGIATEIEIRIKSTSGEFEFNRLSCYPVYGGDGTVKEVFGKIVNVQSVRELEEQANFDALTKLRNKRSMLEETAEILSKSNNNERHALIFMDLDDFKYVNDNLGHIFGDFLLAELGKRLRNGVRQQDLVGRVGGDEFVILLCDIPNFDVIMGKAKMILSTISEDFFDGTTRHTMHGSLGVAFYPEHGSTYEELYHNADLALYSSKHKGKNQVTIYTDELN